MTSKWRKLSEVSERELTPMLRQYIAAKAEAGDALLFFRMGDFFELFFEDALEAAELLNLTLTSRDKDAASNGGAGRIPMAGVPFRTVESYIAKAIAHGRTVALCDQIEDPKEAKGVVKRALVRTVTPGTVIEPDLLEAGANNYLAAVSLGDDRAGLAFLDASTGEFLTAEFSGDIERTLIDELARMKPSEVLLADEGHETLLERLERQFDGMAFRPRPPFGFDPEHAAGRLHDLFGLSTLKGIALHDAPHACAAAGAVLEYLHETQREGAPAIRLPRRYSPDHFVVLDGNTQRNLELTESLYDKKKRGALLGVLDRTMTSMGGRMLRHWLVHPLVEIDAIQARLDAVETFFEDTALRLELRESLKGMADIERLLGKLTARAGNARDARALCDALSRVPRLQEEVRRASEARGALAGLLPELANALDPLDELAARIEREVIDEPPMTIMEGGILKDGWNDALDRLRSLVRGGKDWIATLQAEECARSGIPNLKVRYNKVFGYYIEVSKAHTHKVPSDYERKQTLVNAERYVTPQLKSREEEILTAQERMQKLEYELFQDLRAAISGSARHIQETAEAVATLDVLLALADAAATKNYCKPHITTEDALEIHEGRHPVVEDLMPRGEFVPNDTQLSGDSRLHIITGPNMAGKSTYLRQVALITLMAQMGSYVPAASASVGVVDRIFTRVGASDNLVRGESTFMVEMIETAAILNAASRKSLIVLDEIGRGTSTFDGISIAWSVAEHIHDKVGAKTLFATHYHELTELARQLDDARNLTVAVREYGGKVVFLYRIVEGGADHSYGIQVAKLAGLPPRVIARAREILEMLESGNTSALGLPEQLSLFGAAPQEEAKPSPIEALLREADPDALSPRDAHELLYRLVRLLDSH